VGSIVAKLKPFIKVFQGFILPLVHLKYFFRLLCIFTLIVTILVTKSFLHFIPTCNALPSNLMNHIEHDSFNMEGKILILFSSEV
jgi:hypothetical protein